MDIKSHVKKRIAWIDIAKAIGMLIVLLNHALLNLGVITFLGGMFYMPVFFVISGYTLKEDSTQSIQSFTKSKAKRLLLPYVCFQLFLTGMYTIKNLISNKPFLDAIKPILGAIYSRNMLYANEKDVVVLVPKVNQDLMTSLNAPLWFLTGLFLSLVIYKMILLKASSNRKKELIYLGICMGLGILLKYFCPVLLPWSMDTALISVGFLHIGRIVARNDLMDRLEKKPLYVIGIIIIFVITSYINGSGNMSIRSFGRSVLLYLVVGSLGSICTMLFSKAIEKNFKYLTSILEWIGQHTVGILALHLLVFAMVDFILPKFGIEMDVLNKGLKVLLSVVILVPLDGLIQTYLPFVYGQKRRNK